MNRKHDLEYIPEMDMLIIRDSMNNTSRNLVASEVRKLLNSKVAVKKLLKSRGNGYE